MRTLREQAISILEAMGEPIEPNTHCEGLIQAVIREIKVIRQEARNK
jgi:hypothetical protein